MKSPIHSNKHYVHTPAAGVASGGVFTVILTDAIAEGTTRTNARQVTEGALVKAMYVEYWVKADNPNFTVSGAFLKLPGGGTLAPTAANMAAMASYENKKNCFDFHQGLAPSGDQTLALFRQWYMIPKGKQRQGLGDQIVVTFAFAGSAGDVCGFATYKEYN